jgi:hypothetical protein
MAMIGKKDKPTYYNIVGSQSGAVIATAPASKVLKLRKQLQEQYNSEKLEIILVIDE